jgi:metallophosphoesterase (TIGR03767 family)
MDVTRRRFLTLVAGIAAATGLPERAVAAALTPSGGRTTDGTARSAATLSTLGQTLGPGAPNPLGYRPVVARPGEPCILREELAGSHTGREGRRRSLLTFVHLTDQHIVDVESPGRVEFLDRDADGPCAAVPFNSAFRPHEAATARVADAMVRRIRQVAASPVTGTPITAAICTGDNTDNVQGNELGTFLTLMDGGTVVPRSGDPARYEGVQTDDDGAYWHPSDQQTDIYKDRFGFPDAPWFLPAAQATFDAAGLGVPWYSCFGNHDGLAQGNVPPNPVLAALVAGPVKPTAMPPGTDPCDGFASLGAGLPGAPVVQVTADARRAYLSRRDWIAAHLESPGLPSGHGFSAGNVASDTAYYARDVGAIRFVVLDTVNPGGYSEGSIGDAQLQWLEGELATAQRNHRLVMLFSHHGPRSLDNPFQEPDPADIAGSDLPRHTSADILAVVGRFSCVIAWVNGHTHENIITPRSTYWDIGTAAHIDWPCQSRLIDVVDNRDGTLSVFCVMLDHEDVRVASFARELCGNDPQYGFSKGTGKPEDRNVELVLRHPFPSGPAAPPVAAGLAVPAGGLPANLTLGGALAVAAGAGIHRLRTRPVQNASAV